MYRFLIRTGFALVGACSSLAGGYTGWYLRRRQMRILAELEYEREAMTLPTIEEWKTLQRGEFPFQDRKPLRGDEVTLQDTQSIGEEWWNTK